MEMTTGSLMFFGGIAGIVIGIVLALICLRVFPKQRKRLLDELGSE